MASKKNKPFPSNPEIVTASYRGPDRRDPDADEPVGSVSFDVKGNPVWQLRVDLPRRRKDDKPINLRNCLDLDLLSVQDEEGEESTKPTGGYNPYNRGDE